MAGYKESPKKRKSFWNSFKSQTRFRQIEVTVIALGAVTGLGMIGIYTWDNLQNTRHFNAEHAPLVIISPPRLLQKFGCTAPNSVELDGDFSMGAFEKTYKNIGHGTALEVNGTTVPSGAQVLPTENYRKYPDFASYPSCSFASRFIGGSPLEAGQEATVQSMSGDATVPNEVKKGEPVSITWRTCVAYADQQGNRHATCDTYLLSTKDQVSLRGAQNVYGTQSIPCDGIQRQGFLTPIEGDHCQQ